jgi:hypothetical protein
MVLRQMAARPGYLAMAPGAAAYFVTTGMSLSSGLFLGHRQDNPDPNNPSLDRMGFCDLSLGDAGSPGY